MYPKHDAEPRCLKKQALNPSLFKLQKLNPKDNTWRSNQLLDLFFSRYCNNVTAL